MRFSVPLLTCLSVVVALPHYTRPPPGGGHCLKCLERDTKVAREVDLNPIDGMLEKKDPLEPHFDHTPTIKHGGLPPGHYTLPVQHPPSVRKRQASPTPTSEPTPVPYVLANPAVGCPPKFPYNCTPLSIQPPKVLHCYARPIPCPRELVDAVDRHEEGNVKEARSPPFVIIKHPSDGCPRKYPFSCPPLPGTTLKELVCYTKPHSCPLIDAIARDEHDHLEETRSPPSIVVTDPSLDCPPGYPFSCPPLPGQTLTRLVCFIKPHACPLVASEAVAREEHEHLEVTRTTPSFIIVTDPSLGCPPNYPFSCPPLPGLTLTELRCWNHPIPCPLLAPEAAARDEIGHHEEIRSPSYILVDPKIGCPKNYPNSCPPLPGQTLKVLYCYNQPVFCPLETSEAVARNEDENHEMRRSVEMEARQIFRCPPSKPYTCPPLPGLNWTVLHCSAHPHPCPLSDAIARRATNVVEIMRSQGEEKRIIHCPPTHPYTCPPLPHQTLAVAKRCFAEPIPPIACPLEERDEGHLKEERSPKPEPSPTPLPEPGPIIYCPPRSCPPLPHETLAVDKHCIYREEDFACPLGGIAKRDGEAGSGAE
ncbi:hypothetical protein M231_04844 [Tremella mesenterica]|uniref:Uncharacterized protein n=1 Tax=Tremella mesenterica TaxID=5217 RepID=A0A4Q1BJM2_TREME|nr:uncharacterized protein TREMEDRAFT_66241 [Tremella mesenterica DSM 1558]EIW65874.1 hypothetical protein TREMEDRAFT_66241 [Tremella mesenterica DSM 1558]RXK37846.1 hypothetical protein M231_04844 [Tremella mesenterica]